MAKIGTNRTLPLPQLAKELNSYFSKMTYKWPKVYKTALTVEIQIETTTKYHFFTIGWPKPKISKFKNVDKDVEENELSYNVGGNW